MKKRRINWSKGNPEFFAWAIECSAGEIIVCRNHAPVRSGGRRCEGWDIWINNQYLGSLGSRTFGEIASISPAELPMLVSTQCCSRHKEFAFDTRAQLETKRGGKRPNAGRKASPEARRIKLFLYVTPETFSIIEKMRGVLSRSRYLEELVQSHHL